MTSDQHDPPVPAAETQTGTIDDTRRLTDEDYQAQATFRYAMRRFMRFSENQARGLDITPQQHMLLLAVRGHPSYPAVSITDIAEHLQLRHHSASLLVERGVQKGLLIRRQDAADRRRALVALSPEGAGVLEGITLANRTELRALDDALGQLRSSLRRIGRTADVRSS